MPENKLTHLDEAGRPRMVDVSAKAETEREAIARGAVYLQPQTLSLLLTQKLPKGDALGSHDAGQASDLQRVSFRELLGQEQ